MSDGELNSHGKSRVLSSEPENGFIDALPSLDSDIAMSEFLLQQPSKGVDEHLIEFSEALRTVAKALRRVAEGKASAQAEAAEWKRKYELERARNLQRENRVAELPSGDDNINCCEHERIGNVHNESVLQTRSNEQSEKCCGKHGICSHEVLRDGDRDPGSKILHDKFMRKASFRLCWGCNGSGQHKHDIVSFERGNITTAERSSKQISLKWESPPQTVLILTKPNSISVRHLCAEMVRWLKDQKKINVFVEPRVRTELLTESSNFNFVQSWEDEKEILLLHTKVDLVVTLGGDGTVLWAASMFKGPVPPLVPFSLGSLGFMTPFLNSNNCFLEIVSEITDGLPQIVWDYGCYFLTISESEHYHECLDSILRGPISITLRHRLQCHVIRDAAKDELETDEPILVLNEVTIDRGISSYLTFLECYCDSSFVTSVQGDGLILSTTSGSTAYSLAAGGSMVHPQVPGILFTPICPHSLSFRPLILPEYVTLRVQVPFNSRGHAWASFDGKDRKELSAGDALVISMAPWPVPTACQVDSTNDFLRSIHEGLHWNLRKTQSFDGPRETL